MAFNARGAFFGAAIAAFMGSAALAAPAQQHNSNAVWFENWVGLSNATMRIQTPGGEVETIFSKSGTPVFQLTAGSAADGVYRYELSAATNKTAKIVNPLDNGRGETAKAVAAVPFYTTGSFVVSRGVIVTPEVIVEGAE